MTDTRCTHGAGWEGPQGEPMPCPFCAMTDAEALAAAAAAECRKVLKEKDVLLEQARDERDAAREALAGVAESQDSTGALCWCCEDASAEEHEDYCLAARAALPAPVPPGETTRETPEDAKKWDAFEERMNREMSEGDAAMNGEPAPTEAEEPFMIVEGEPFWVAEVVGGFPCYWTGRKDCRFTVDIHDAKPFPSRQECANAIWVAGLPSTEPREHIVCAAPAAHPETSPAAVVWHEEEP